MSFHLCFIAFILQLFIYNAESAPAILLKFISIGDNFSPYCDNGAPGYYLRPCDLKIIVYVRFKYLVFKNEDQIGECTYHCPDNVDSCKSPPEYKGCTVTFKNEEQIQRFYKERDQNGTLVFNLNVWDRDYDWSANDPIFTDQKFEYTIAQLQSGINDLTFTLVADKYT